MHHHRLVPLFVLAAIGLAGCLQLSSPPATSAPPSSAPVAAPSVADLVNATVTSGETELTSRGYTAAVTQNLTTYWWHPSGSCVRVVTADDHYKVVVLAAASNCGRDTPSPTASSPGNR